jgi:dihydroneopterin aldolase
MTNYIFLHGINLKTNIGVPAAERSVSQILIIDIDIEINKNTKFENDNLNDTIDYAEIEHLIKKIGCTHQYKLLESLGEEISTEIKKKFNVKRILLKIKKKNILLDTDFVGVILER